MHDYDHCLLRLSERLCRMASNNNVTKESKDLSDLSTRLFRLANELESGRWDTLEYTFDESQFGRYASLCAGLREISDIAVAEKDLLPNSRARPEYKRIAVLFLHVMYHHGKPAPKLYDNNQAVLDLSSIFEKAGFPRSTERVRGVLTEAMKEFDPYLFDPALEDIL